MKELPAPMDGQVMTINVKVGDEVKKGETVVAIMEAIKMEIPVYAEDDGKITEIKIKEGDSVEQGDILFILE